MYDVETSPSSTSRRGLGIALVAAPLLWLVAEFVSPALKSKAADQLAVISAHPDRWYWYTVLLAAGCIVFVPGVIALARVARGGGRRLSAIGGTLLGFSLIVAVGDAMTQLVFWQMVKGGADQGQMAALLDRFDNSAASDIFFLPGGLSWLVGTVLLTIALARSRVVPVWVALTFGVGSLVNLVGFMANSAVIIGAGAAIMLVALGYIARLFVTGSAYDAVAVSRPVQAAA
jgi:hypothetical protein